GVAIAMPRLPSVIGGGRSAKIPTNAFRASACMMPSWASLTVWSPCSNNNVKGRAMRLLKSGVFLLAYLTLWLGLNPLGVQSAPKSPRAPATQGQLTLLCFDKDFDSERDATVWSMEVRASLQANVDHYLMQRTKSNGRKFVVCLGPFKNTKE